MKVLHTGDWHLGKKLQEFSRIDEQKAVLEEICQIADREAVDAVVVAGDLYDTFNPPAEASDLLYKTLHRLSRQGSRAVVAIAGNHDAPERIEAPTPLARECGIIFAGFPYTQVPLFRLDTGLAVTRSEPGFVELSLPGCAFPLRLLLTPYANETRLKQFLGTENQEQMFRERLAAHWEGLSAKYGDGKGALMLVAHLFMISEGSEPEPEPEDERPILHVGGAQAVYAGLVPKAVQYTAMGHLHRFHQVNPQSENPVVYSGSLLEYSFSEVNQQKAVSVVTMEPGKPAQYQAIPLQSGKKLHRVAFEEIEEALGWLKANFDTFVELTLVSDTFLDGRIKKSLFQLHPGIVALIPRLKNLEVAGQAAQIADPGGDIYTLFNQYFREKQGQAPGPAIEGLFRELLQGED